jgi:Protein of unknown function (DUF4232)
MKNVLRALALHKVKAVAVTAVVAGAAAAAAIVPNIAASASSDSAARPASAGQPATAHRCTTADLRVWLAVPGDGTAGPIYYALELSNVSSSACTVYGYPGVSAVAAGGKQLGSAARRDAVKPPTLITLAKGGTAHVLLGITDPGFFSPSACPRANAIGLRVYPPNDTASTIVDFPFAACGKAGPSFLSVSVAQPGVGIPGYNV